MVHDYNTWGKRQELVKMNQDSQVKDMENNILSSINSLKDEILNLKEIFKISKMRMENFDRNVSNLRDVLCKVWVWP